MFQCMSKTRTKIDSNSKQTTVNKQRKRPKLQEKTRKEQARTIRQDKRSLDWLVKDFQLWMKEMRLRKSHRETSKSTTESNGYRSRQWMPQTMMFRTYLPKKLEGTQLSWLLKEPKSSLTLITGILKTTSIFDCNNCNQYIGSIE